MESTYGHRILLQWPEAIPRVLSKYLICAFNEQRYDFSEAAIHLTDLDGAQVPEGEHLTSGVYQLLCTGTLSSGHHDHPSQRHKDEPALRQVRTQGTPS